MGPIADARRWASAVPGLTDRLHDGARVAVVGCGRGELVVALARAFPTSVFSGFDHRERDIAIARMAAAGAGVSERVTFEVVRSPDIKGSGYDLVWWIADAPGWWWGADRSHILLRHVTGPSTVGRTGNRRDGRARDDRL